MKFRAFLLIAVLFGLFGQVMLAQDNTTVVTAFIENQPNSLDPHAARTADENLVISNVCDGLVDQDPITFEPVAALAESWTISEDNLVYTFTLREGVLFHDGSTLDAADVKYTFDRFAKADFGTSYVAGLVLRDIAGWAEARPAAVGEGTATPVAAAELAGVQVIDERTVQITLARPITSFLVRLTLAGAGIIAEGSAESADFSTGPVCAGPFTVAEFVPGDRLVMNAFADYWNGAPEVQQVIVRVIPEVSTQVIEFEAGNLDLAVAPEADLPRIRADETLAAQLLEIPVLSNFNLRVNLNDEKMGNVLVRRALAMAIDRETIVQTVLQGQGAPAQALYAPGMSTYNPDYNPFAYNPEMARQLLAEAGYPDGIELTVRNDIDEVGNRVLNAMAQSAAEAGITLNINVTEASVYTDDRTNCTMEMGYIRWTMDYPDPENMVVLLLPNAATRVNCGYGDIEVAPQINDLYTQAISLPLGSERDELFREIEQIAMDQVMIIPIFHRVTTLLVSERLGGTPVDNSGGRRFDLIDLQ